MYVLCSVCATLVRSLYSFGVVVVRTQCGLYATSVLRLCKFGVTPIQCFATSMKLLCGFLISRNAPELRSMGEKKAPGVWIYSVYFVNVRHFEFGFAELT